MESLVNVGVAREFAQAQTNHYLIMGNMLVCAMDVKEHLGAVANNFSRKHPLACWMTNLISIFSSQILTNFLLNEPVIASLSNTKQVLLATLIWYCVYYSPFDFMYKFVHFLPIKLLVYCANEIYSVTSISSGIRHASKIFPNSQAVMLIVGVARGNGAALFRLLEALVARGSWNAELIDFVRPSYTTKACLLTALVFIVNDANKQLPAASVGVGRCAVGACGGHSTSSEQHLSPVSLANNWPLSLLLTSNTNSHMSDSQSLGDQENLPLLLPNELLVLTVSLVCIYLRACAILLNLSNPFAPIERLLCLALFGGLWDALARAIAIDERKTAVKTSGAGVGGGIGLSTGFAAQSNATPTTIVSASQQQLLLRRQLSRQSSLPSTPSDL